MNWNTFVAASCFAVLNVAALSAHADVQSEPQAYAHAPRLDIRAVIATVEDGGAGCGIVNTRMTYLDASGAQKVLDYSKFAECGNQGN